MTSFYIGFVVGGFAVALLISILLRKRIKALSLGKDGFNIVMQERESADIELDIPIDGRWAILTSKGAPPKFSEGFELHGKVRIKRGESLRIFLRQGATDEDIKKLARHADNPIIKSLVLYRCKRLTPTGLRLLAQFRFLVFLDLTESSFSDADISPICELKSLVTLTIRGCQISDQGIANLKRALPGCNLVRN